MTKIITIRATTTDAEIAVAIPYADMRVEARDRRDDAAAVLAEQGDQIVLELHDIDGVDVLYSPAYSYAMVNERSPGVGDSLLIATGECDSPEMAVLIWRTVGAPIGDAGGIIDAIQADAQRKAWAALEEARGRGGRPAELGGGRRVGVYLDSASLARAAELGGGNVSKGIRRALSTTGY